MDYPKSIFNYHEVPFEEKGTIIKGTKLLPDTLPENPNPVLADFYAYYKTKRGYHSRIN